MDPLTPPGDRRAELRALLLLDGLPGVGPRRLRAVVERYGSAVAALAAPDLAAALPRGAHDALDAGDVADDVDRRLEDADAGGMTCLTWTDPSYPGRLLGLADPPPVLFVRGRSALLDVPGVAVVGSRRCTARARDVARRLGGAVAARGLPVVSGLALGVDGAAHRGALDADGPTVAVVGTGADRAYPPSHAGLFGAVVARGMVVSEFLPGTPPLPHHFPRRNRIMAGLAHTLVVVEAGARSGALITLDHALDLGLDVWAVPGPIDQRACAGSNRLLAEGARPLVSVDDFVARLVAEGAPRVPPPAALPEAGAAAAGDVPATSGGHGAADVPAPLSAEEARILDALADGDLASDEVADRLGVAPHRLLPLLTALELRGRVERRPGARFRRAG